MNHNTDVETVGTKVTDEMEYPLHNFRILLAEGCPNNQRLIGLMMKEAGAIIALASNGQIAFELETLSMTKSHPFDVILMGMKMPMMDGYKVTQKLRNDGYSRPILAITAHVMIDTVRNVSTLGAIII